MTTPLLCLLFLLLSSSAAAQRQSKGDASFRIEYQQLQGDAFQGENFELDYWSTESHVLLFSVDYALSERWSVYGAVPYVRKRFVPGEVDPFGTGLGDPHNPNDPYWIDFVPPDKRFHDDGDYHGGFQDLSLGVMYRAIDGPAWTVAPYLGYSAPVSNYPFFAKAAIGKQLWNIPVGVDVGFVPYFSDWHFRGNLAYVFSEKPLDQNVDYLLGSLHAGYWFTPRLSVQAFLAAKHVRNGQKLGQDFSPNPFDYPASYDTVEWWMHDRLLGSRFVNVGLSFDFALNERYQVSGSYHTAARAEQSADGYAFTLAITRYWRGD